VSGWPCVGPRSLCTLVSQQQGSRKGDMPLQSSLTSASKGSLGMDLLLYFKPVGLYVGSAEQRFGDTAAVCADFVVSGLHCTVCPMALCLL